MEDIHVLGKPEGNWNFDIKRNPSVFTPFDGFCVMQIINATHVSETDLLYFGLYPSEKMKVIIVDTARSPYYMLNSQTLKDEAIKQEQTYGKYYSIRFEEISRMEDMGECTNYGEQAKFKTYADCIANEQEQIFKPLLGGCMVPWLSAPGSSRTCKGRIQLNFSLFQDSVAEFWEIARVSGHAHTTSCLKPCVELQAYATLTSKEEGEDFGVLLNFERKVKVTKYQKAYGLFDLVVEVGSSLGLWIGLSAIGVLDLLLQAGHAIKERIRMFYCQA